MASNSSFDEFVSGNVRSLLRTAYLITQDEGEAEDLVQECLIRLARRWRRISSMEQPLAYARRVLVRMALRGSVKRSRLQTELVGEVLDVAEDLSAFDLVATREELSSVLLRLTPRQRTILALRFFHDLSEAQVAELTGCSTATVSSTTSRGLAQLRGFLEEPPSVVRSTPS
jgi:RNA polymerase sigma-70 factor (sigma-E family)